MPYLVPGHLRLFIWSQIVFYIRTVDHFAVGYLSFLQMADFATEAFSLVALFHGHRHGHFHAVCGVPKQIKIYIKKYSVSLHVDIFLGVVEKRNHLTSQT